jgi:hypothetical protein
MWMPGAGVAIASPVLVFPVAYVLAYGMGVLVGGLNTGQHASDIALAIPLGGTAYLLGLGAGWSDRSETLVPVDASRKFATIVVAAGLVIIGVGALAAYLGAIGGIPLFMESLEQARVDAAERGGAALRVLSLLSLLGIWLLTAVGFARHHRRMIAVTLGAAIVVAGGQLLTGNRAPAFSLVQVTVLVAVLAHGATRLRPTGVLAVGAGALLLVLAAAAIGGFRYQSTPSTWRDPTIARAVATEDHMSLTLVALGDYLAVPVQNFSSTMDAVPQLIGWRLGLTYLQPVGTVAPGRQTTFDEDLKVALGQRYAGGGTVPSLLGEAYANFGPLGWLLVPALIGWVLARLYALAKVAQTPETLLLYAYALLHAANATIGGLVVANIFPYIAYTVLGLLAVASLRATAVHSQ